MVASIDLHRTLKQHSPEACTWTGNTNTSPSSTFHRVLAGHQPRLGAPGKAMCLAPSLVPWCWALQTSKAWSILRRPSLKPRVCVMSGMLTTDSSVEVDHLWPRNQNPFRRPHIANRRICQCSATSSRLCWAYRTHNVQPATLALLDTGATRASCCALGEATRGHNSVVQVIRDALPILWPFCRNSRTHSGTELRAADVLTSALQCSTSPSAPHMLRKLALDCTQTMAADNFGYHGPYLNNLHVQKIDCLSVGGSRRAGRHACVKHNLDGVLHGVVGNRKRRNLGCECWRQQSDVEAPWGQATNAASDGKTELGTHRQPARTKQANNGPNSKRLGKLREWGETRHTGNQPKKELGQCATRPGICTDHLKCQETVLPKANRTVSAWTCASRSQLWFAREDWKTACSVAAIRLRKTHFLRVRKSTWTSRSPALAPGQRSASCSGLPTPWLGRTGAARPYPRTPSVCSPRLRLCPPRWALLQPPHAALDATAVLLRQPICRRKRSRSRSPSPSSFTCFFWCSFVQRPQQNPSLLSNPSRLHACAVHAAIARPDVKQFVWRGNHEGGQPVAHRVRERGRGVDVRHVRPLSLATHWPQQKKRGRSELNVNQLRHWLTQLLHWASAVAPRQWSINLSLFTHSALILSETRVPHTPCAPTLGPPTHLRQNRWISIFRTGGLAKVSSAKIGSDK